jgi:mannose-6-phosphate isomerase-like protein (cupin superfamily)
MRSGYLLATDSFFYVVSGKVQVWSLHEEGTRKQIYEANQSFIIPAFVPYILHFLEDSVTVEYWKGEFRCFYYHPYRVRL